MMDLRTGAARSAYEIPLVTLAGEQLDATLLRGRATLIVNVASRCGLTPQYEGLQHLYEQYADEGFVVLGAPCDQFAGQEPGSAEEIAEFCWTTYSVTFPLTEKLDVNGPARHPLYALLTEQPDESGRAGDVQWNFEKFLVSPRGETVARFRPTTLPDDVELVAAIESVLPGGAVPSWSTRLAGEVVPGDRVRLRAGAELTVSRIDDSFLGRDELICLVEDTPARWVAQPLERGSAVEVLMVETSVRQP
jgi:glutathione peroxidase